MIVQTARGYEKALYKFMKRWCFAKDHEIEAWLKYKFDADRMFLYIEDGHIVSCLQYARRTLQYDQKKAAVSVIEMGLTAGNKRNQGFYKALAEAFMQKAACNELVSLVKTSSVKVYAGLPFSEITFMKEYTLPSSRVETLNFSRTRRYRPNIDVYPLYEKFMAHFDGSIRLERSQFENELAYLHAAKKKIDIMMDEHYEPIGLAVYSVQEAAIHIELLLYLNSDALEQLFSNLALISDKIYISVSHNEALEKLYPNLKWKKKMPVLASINNPKLFASFLNKDKAEAFKDLSGPMWFGLM